MVHAEVADAAPRVRRRRLAAEKLKIVRLTMEPGASVAEIAREHGVNAHQVFKWRRLFERGQLIDGPPSLRKPHRWFESDASALEPRRGMP